MYCIDCRWPQVEHCIRESCFFSLGKIFDSISVDAGIQGNWIVFRLFVEVVAIEKVAVNIDIEIHVPIAVLMAGERLRHHASRK